MKLETFQQAERISNKRLADTIQHTCNIMFFEHVTISDVVAFANVFLQPM